jgi:hypothetical protein
MMTGGYYERLLAIIPDAGKLGQTEKLICQVKEDFGNEFALRLTKRAFLTIMVCDGAHSGDLRPETISLWAF